MTVARLCGVCDDFAIVRSSVMFERYTEAARRTLFFARYASSELGAPSIETEHILLGLLREPQGVLAVILAQGRTDAAEIRIEIEQQSLFREKIPTTVEIPFEADAIQALNHGAEEADRLGHAHIGSEHLLLGLLRTAGSRAEQVLVRSGIRLENAREITRLLAERGTIGAPAAGRAEAFEEIEGIKRLVDLLAGMSDRPEAEGLSLRIQHAVDGLKRHLA